MLSKWPPFEAKECHPYRGMSTVCQYRLMTGPFMNINAYQEVVIDVVSIEIQAEASFHHNLYADRPMFYCLDDLACNYYPTLTLDGSCLYPNKMKGDAFTINLIGHELHRGQLSVTLDGFHKRDEYGSRIYRKYRGEQIPVMSPPPKGVGSYEKIRGELAWQAHMWMGREFVRDVMAMMGIKDQLYIYINTYTENRTHWIRELKVTSKNPIGDLI